VGIVIGTFAAVPYVHVALECRKRLYPDIPLLVNDDGSPEAPKLRALCRQYGAFLIVNKGRKRPGVGDVSAFVHGLEWAAPRKLEILVKLSRRFIPLYNWVPQLQELAWRTQYATYSNECRYFQYGFRTECMAMHVESWRHSEVFERMRELVRRNEPAFVEGFVHNLARAIHLHNCDANRDYERRYPRPPDKDAYGLWDITGTDRTLRRPHVLWHDCDGGVDYNRIAKLLGLPYSTIDFEDANQGHGEV
jgi:hypothetical protein